MTEPLFLAPRKGIVRVALPVPIDRLFDYSVPSPAPAGEDERNLDATPGKRVLVKFSGRLLTGVIVAPEDVGRDEGDSPDPVRLVDIDRVLDAEPVISGEMVRILSEAAREVLCPIGIALASALPPGAAPRIQRVCELTPRGERALESGAVSAADRPLLERLLEGAVPAARLVRDITNGAKRLDALEDDGLLRRQSRAISSRARVPTERFVRVADGVDVEAVCAESLRRSPKQIETLRRIERAGEALRVSVLREEDASASTRIRQLAERGLVEVTLRRVATELANVFGELGTESNSDADSVELTTDQRSVLEPLCDAVANGKHETFLLHGVTGSGKTEIYMRAIASALSHGRQALILVPEITLTHQIVARLRQRFGDQLAVLHSGLKPGERLEQWERLRIGDTPIAVGARSALFAPLEKLGVIVIDEEHDGAYKNEEGFRYHAVILAEARARAAGCPLVLGSATPALETRHRAETGDITRLVLPRRIGGRPLPQVELVDLEVERRKVARGRKLILTRPLRNAIKETLTDGGQTLLLLNRRGFSTRIFCFDCGHAEHCEDCDVALVFHASDHQLRCHYCDFECEPPERCRGCGQPDTALLGVGTERLEEEVRSRFPDARLARLDRDSAQKRGYTESVLRGLRDRSLDIVIGTQMIAKGHDFPGVRLVGVVAADIGLHMPDFRAAERTFQLLTQVAGRAGRSSNPGRVVVQTFVPNHYAIAPVIGHDYEGFYQAEIGHRRELGYPPFGVLCQAMISSENEAAAKEAADVLGDTAKNSLAALRSAAGTEGADEVMRRACEILGPAPAPITKLRGRFRFQLLVKGADPIEVRAATEAISIAAGRLPATVQTQVDVRPHNML